MWREFDKVTLASFLSDTDVIHFYSKDFLKHHKSTRVKLKPFLGLQLFSATVIISCSVKVKGRLSGKSLFYCQSFPTIAAIYP